MVKIHHDTVDMYLEDVILHSIHLTADTEAREEIHHMAEELNNITYAMEETYVSRTELKLVNMVDMTSSYTLTIISEIPKTSESEEINK